MQVRCGESITAVRGGPRPHHCSKNLMSQSYSKWTATIELSAYTQTMIESSRFGAVASYGTHVVHLKRAHTSIKSEITVWVCFRVRLCLCVKVSLCVLRSIANMCKAYATVWGKGNKPIPWALEECRWCTVRREGSVCVCVWSLCPYLPPLWCL